MDVQVWLQTMVTDGATAAVSMVSALLDLGFMWLFGPLIAFEIASFIYEYVIRGGGNRGEN